MPDLDREVAGVRCREVLAELSALVDGDLPEERVAQLSAHVRGCDWCERFGGRFGAVMTRFRAALAEAEPLPGDVGARLRARVHAAMEAAEG
ncbi:MAG: zf-HC2 domain-containing protein [Gemmatimonadales bacterium]|jgi:anti-sigma factor RsiW|nr:zf-HC2 domain-containing protein [Gemmatimonadales bacterium]